jgi:hypothetical protein
MAVTLSNNRQIGRHAGRQTGRHTDSNHWRLRNLVNVFALLLQKFTWHIIVIVVVVD